MNKKFDLLDIKLLQELQRDGRISITELAENVNSSRLTVSRRLKRLFEEKLVIVRGGLNANKMGFRMACVGLEAKGDMNRTEIENRLKGCPRIMNIFRTAEKANIHLAVWGEDDKTINSTIESFRDIPNIDLVYCHYLGSPIHGEIPIPIHSTSYDVSPCGKICSNCYKYQNEWCLGCPVTKYCKNPIIEKV